MSVPTSVRPKRESGFTLLEALVVLTIIGVLAAIVTVPINSYWQRARTETTAGDIRNFLQQAFTEAINQHTQITVTLQQTAGQWVLQLAPPPLKTVDRYPLPDFVSLALNPAAGSGGWPTSGAVRTLTCDTMGRTIDPTTGNQVISTVTMSITHTRMIDGSLTPKVRYDIQVFPLWNVTVRKNLV